jgi:hypothetical protein
MRFILILLSLLAVAVEPKAQQAKGTPTYYASFRSYASGGRELPFWFRSNQNGTLPVANNFTQLLRTGFYRNLSAENSNPWDYFMGAELVAGYAGKPYFQPNQYWLGGRYRWLVVKAGAMADPLRYGGLSSTNGNLDASGNSRPVPDISLSSNGYVPFPYFGSPVSWKAHYSEGVLWDNGYLQKARLHHKNLYFKVDLPTEWSIAAGIEHYVFWGGVSPSDGKISVRWGEYLYFVSGIRLGSGSKGGAGVNLPENHLGIYSMEICKRWQGNHVAFYWNHPFENRAGLELANAADGLFGIHLKRNEDFPYLSEVVYEWMNTFGQGYNSTTGSAQDYFNDQTYRSGFTHFAQMMGSPLFVPKLNTEGGAAGFPNNRIRMHHLGLKGGLLTNLDWKLMLTFSNNQGSYDAAFPATVGQFSFLSELNYQLPHLPLQVSAAVAGDSGKLNEGHAGVYLGIRWEPLQDADRWRGNWIIRKR